MPHIRFKLPFFVLAAFELVGVTGLLILGAHSLIGTQPWPDGADAVRAPILALILVVCMFAVGLYDWRFATRMSEVLIRLGAALLLALVAYALVAYFFVPFRVPPEASALGIAVAVPAIAVGRAAFLQLADAERFKARVLVIGTGERAARIAALRAGPLAVRFEVAGYITVESAPLQVPHEHVLEMPQALADYARRMEIDEIVVAPQERRGSVPLEALVAARLAGIRVTDYQTFCERALGRVDLDAVSASWFLYSDGFRTGRVNQAVKRGFDIAVSIIMLIALLPVLILAAVAIRLESSGPVLYRQERVGLGGKRYTLMKFRSMRTDAETEGGPAWATRNDPRVTRVGEVIRKTRIDEIPQIFNVLKGDMSFVGPRPERPYFVGLLADEIPFYNERHTTKPGITGWAQINHPYGASVEDARKKLEYDLCYIKHFSIVFDLLIILQTVRIVLWAEGAR